MKYVDHSNVALSENMPRQLAFTNFAVALVITHSSCEYFYSGRKAARVKFSVALSNSFLFFGVAMGREIRRRVTS